MAELHSVYKCALCGNIVEVIHSGQGNNLVCCGQPMILQKENTVDASLEKHVPVVEKSNTGISVKVGSILHPMEEKHYIEFIEVISLDGKSYKKFLNPGEAPVAEFCIQLTDISIVREYCNLHGLWKK
jgi:superoxide reductase